MPNAPAPKPERDFCTSCGFPIRGNRCDACGSTQDGRRPSDGEARPAGPQRSSYPSLAEADTHGLERAFDAHRARDPSRLVELIVTAEGGSTARAGHPHEGVGWIAVVRSALVFVTLRAQNDELTIEAPIARLPARQRLPAMRLALELCARDAAASRVCLRGELLLLRFTTRVSLLTPPVLRHYLRETGHLATRFAGLLMVSLDALPPFADDERATLGFDAIGRAKKIRLGAGGSIRRSIPPPPPDANARPQEQANDVRNRVTRPMRRDEHAFEVDAQEKETASVEAIPAILSPMFSPPSAPRPSLSSAALDAIHDGRSAQAAPTAPSVNHGRTRPEGVRDGAQARAPEVEIDATSKRPVPGQRSSEPGASSSAKSASGEPPLPPPDRLALLLRHAQSLISLALEERPPTMAPIVRSAVFLAIYDFKDTLPDAVAHLYRRTGVGRDAGTPAEPALVVMERVIVARGAMAKEKPIAIEPMTSAAQAKEHVGRYLQEIDRSPSDRPLRHFLALGALTELLVRTKLPPQTEQRLRDIVAHAHREGPKSTAVELMMTALNRINS